MTVRYTSIWRNLNSSFYAKQTISPTNPQNAARHAQLVGLVQGMLDLHKRLAAEGNPQMRTVLQRQIEAMDGRIDGLVYALYGLAGAEIAVGGESLETEFFGRNSVSKS